MESDEILLSSFDPKNSVLFGSRQRVLVGEGRFATLATPAVGGQSPTSAIQCAVAQALRSARAAGIDQPIVMGSIPFDVTKRSCLVVPERYRWMEPTEDDLCRPNHAGTSRSQIAHAAERGRGTFRHAVHELLHLLAAGTVQKVVLSRSLDVSFGKSVDTAGIVRQLLAAASTGFPYSVPLGDTATLIGVSPELLVRKRGALVVSNPLAGSIPRSRCADEAAATAHLMASDKDLREHRYVVEQVREVLAHYCADLRVPEQPSLVQTPTMWHLSSLVKGTLERGGINALGLACALHPTPAVCGWPCQPARAAIERLEGYDRGLFTGMTGWMDANGDGEWAVTIRCGIVREDGARVYAGAGIVQGSCPELEWEETAAKMTLMLGALDLAGAEAY